MSIGSVLLIVGIALALLDAVFVNKRVPYLLHVAVILIGLGVLLGAAPLLDKA